MRSTPRLVVRGRHPTPWRCSTCGRAFDDRPPSGDTSCCDPCLDKGWRGEPYIPLTVQLTGPKQSPDDRPVLAVCLRTFQCMTEHGEVFDLEQLADRIRERRPGETGWWKGCGDQIPPSLVVTDAGVDLLAWLDNSKAARSPFWQWQVALTEMSAWRPEARARVRRMISLQPRPMRFGYASIAEGKRRQEGRARWYQMVDVHRFCEMPDGWGEPDARELLRFGVQLRDWCNHHQLPVGSSGSAIGARLLRDRRFGGDTYRRKVPAATNDRARRMLPGNHYELLTVTDKRIPAAHKFDMRRAHHWAAMTTGFPHPDTLWAHGALGTHPRSAIVKERGAITRGSRKWRSLINQSGLFLAGVEVGAQVDELDIPQLRKPGRRWVYLTSEEIPYVLEHPHARLGDIWAAWTSPDPDTRLNEYAWWAQERLDESAAPSWLKPTLLSAYGLLAARARQYRSAWRWTSRPEGGVGWQTTHGMLLGVEREPGRPREPAHTNVTWRCLIESKVRLEALRFARQLRDTGCRPLAIYADAVFATPPPGQLVCIGEADLPVPWRWEGVIHDLTFDGPQRYRAREETRLPGIPRNRGELTKAI